MCSEQSAGILPLLALALFAGAQAWEAVKHYEWPEYSQPSCQMHGDYVGRVEGRAKFEYGEICYE